MEFSQKATLQGNVTARGMKSLGEDDALFFLTHQLTTH